MIWFRINANKFINLLNVSLNFKIKSRFDSRFFTSTRKQFGKEKFEFKRDVVVYELKNETQIIQLWAAGAGAFGLCMFGAFEIQNLNTIDKHIEKDDLPDNSRLNGIVYGFSSFVTRFSVLIGFAIAFFGCAIFLGCQKYVISSVKRMTLLKGGQNLLIEFYRRNPFSKNYKTVNISLKDISFKNYRGDKSYYIYFKIFKHRSGYQIHKEGQFDSVLFDQVICFQRNLGDRR